MAYRHHVLRCTAFGSCYTGAEEWSTGFYMGYADADAGDLTQESADALLAEWEILWANSNMGFSSKYLTEGVRIAKLHKDTGKTILGQNFYAYPAVAVAGGGGATTQIPQVTLVASLQARPDRGLGAKGRMYLPGVNHGISSTTARLTSTTTTNMAIALQTFFNNINGAFDIPGNVILASKGRNLGIGGDMPVNRYVQDVLVGDVYDTQRRRRNQLQEAYSTREIAL